MSIDNEYIKKLQKMIDFEVEDTNSIQYTHHKGEILAEIEKDTFFRILSFIEESFATQKAIIRDSKQGLFSILSLVDKSNIAILEGKIARVQNEKDKLENFFTEAKDNRDRVYELSMKAHKRNIDYLQGQINDALNSTKKSIPESEIKKSPPMMRYTFNDAINDLNICISNCDDEKTRKDIEETKLNLIKKHSSTLKNLVENGYVASSQTKG